MLDKIKENVGYVIAAIIAILYGLFKFEQKKADEAQADLRNAEADKRDTKLEAEKSTNDVLIKDVQKDAEEDKKEKLTPEEMVEFLKKV